MSNQLNQEIHDLLTHIYQADTTEQRNESQPQRTLNVYIEVDEEATDLPPTIESTLDEQPITNMIDQADTPTHTKQPSSTHVTETHSTKQQRGTNPTILLFLIMSIVGVLAGITYALLLPMWTPSATITIVTASRQLTITSTLQLVTNGTADPMKNQLPGRVLPAITMSQVRTIPATGTIRQDAKVAHGLITFYNAAPYVQTIEVGTLLTGADGVQVLTDLDATIPAAIIPTEGQATVYAHAVTTGPEGNVRAGDVYGQCCRLNVFVTNDTFHGGQDARSYQTVSQQDINSAVMILKTGLAQSIQVALQAQVQVTETLITPLSCTQKVMPDHAVGEEATQVSIVVTENCTGMVYPARALIALATQLATQDATTRLGTGYTTTGVQTSIIQATLKDHGSSDLQVKSVSLWVYSFGPEQQEAIKAMIAGMSKDKAIATLLHLIGVQSVSISLKSGNVLPAEVQYIHLLFLQV